MSILRLQLCGNVRIEQNGRLLTTDRRKAVALLAYLAVSRHSHAREALATLFWPETDPSRAFAYLRRAVWELNNLLGEGWLLVDRQQVALAPAANIWVDVWALREALADGEMGRLQTAVSHIGGDFMAGFTLRDSGAFDAWQEQQAEVVRRELGEALAMLARQLAEAGAWDAAVATAQRWLAQDTLNEAAHRQIMRLYAQMGRRVDAIRQYEACAGILEEELGISPDLETITLLEQIRNGTLSREGALFDRESNQAAVTQAAPQPFPDPPTPFVGRQAMLEEVGMLLSDPGRRLVTLVGPGGMGKTRLAIQLTKSQRHRYADGAFFVPLVPLQSIRQLETAVARALNVSFIEDESVGNARTQLLEYLRGKQLLLVLDNFEHLIVNGAAEAAAQRPLLTEIMRHTPQIQLLVTSRVRLNLQGETPFNVTGMGMPPSDGVLNPQNAAAFSSIQLFLSSAQRVRPDFNLTADSLPAIVAICRYVDGMPLAIELAAGWLELLTPAEILSEIKQGLDFLETDTQDVPLRQRSMRAVFDSTWQLLTQPERDAFRQLSIFSSGFSREAAQAVSGASLRLLMQLTNKSLIRRQEDGLYHIHELLRQFANELLQADPTLRQQANQRYSDHFLAMLREQGPKMRGGPEQKGAFQQIDSERDNVILAWAWAATQGDFAAIEPLLVDLTIFYEVWGFTENDFQMLATAVAHLQQCMTSEPSRDLARFLAKCLITQVWYDDYFGSTLDFPAVVQRVNGLITAYDLKPELGICLAQFGALYDWQIDSEGGIAILEEACDYLQGHEWELAYALHILSHELVGANRHEEARYCLTESLQINRALNNTLGIYQNLSILSRLRIGTRDYEGAIAVVQQMQALAAEIGNYWSVAHTWFQYGATCLSAGDYAQAARCYAEARRTYGQGNHPTAQASMLSWESMALVRMGAYEEALAKREASRDARFTYESPILQGWHDWELGDLLRILGRFSEARQLYEASYGELAERDMIGAAFYYRGMGELAYADGRFDEAYDLYAQSVAQAVQAEHNWAVAFGQCGQGRAALRQGRLEVAYRHFMAALALAQDEEELSLLLLTLQGLASWLVAKGEMGRAAEVASFVVAHQALWAEFRPQAEADLQTAVSHLPSAQAAAAQERGQRQALPAVLDLFLKTGGES